MQEWKINSSPTRNDLVGQKKIGLMKTNEWLGTNFITSARIEKYQEIFKHKHQIYSKIEKNISIKSYSPKKTRITFEEAMKGEVRKKSFLIR